MRQVSGAKNMGSDQEDSVPELVVRASHQMSELVREEMRLARAEMVGKVKRVGAGSGMLGGAGLAAILAAQALVAGAIAALTLLLPLWASALVVAGLLAATAGVLAAAGKRRVTHGLPPVPEEALESLKADISVIKERTTR